MSEKQALPVSDIGVYRQGSFLVKRNACTLTLTEKELTWAPEQTKTDERSTVRIRDVVAVSNGPSTRGDKSQFTVVYVVQRKDFILKRAEVTFCGDRMTCDSFCKQLESALNGESEHPKRLLVIINPVSGQKKGEKVYNDKVAPVFLEANIQTDVIVTEREHHAEELVSTYDLKSIDGIALVSGDGLYHEVANGLTRRQAQECGENAYDPNFIPSQLPVSIGLIPNGSCNGIAKCSMGNADVQTAAFAIALGYRRKDNLMSVFNGEDLVAFSSSMVAYGIWGDFIQNKSNQGRFRFALAAANMLFLKPFREMNLTVSYRCRENVDTLNQEHFKMYQRDETYTAITGKPTTNSDEKKTIDSLYTGSDKEKPGLYPNLDNAIKHVKEIDINADNVGKENVNTDLGRDLRLTHDDKSGWAHMSGSFIGMLGMNSVEFDAAETPVPSLHGVNDVTAFMANTPSKRCEFFNSLCKMMSSPAELVTKPLDNLPTLLANEMKVTVNNPSEPESDFGMKEHVLNIDGKVYYLKTPEYHVRLFPERLTLFCNLPKITGRVPADLCRGQCRC